ncbi:hypothetical protein Ancab_017505 [Ancistrocladus abbreviatus]
MVDKLWGELGKDSHSVLERSCHKVLDGEFNGILPQRHVKMDWTEIRFLWQLEGCRKGCNLCNNGNFGIIFYEIECVCCGHDGDVLWGSNDPPKSSFLENPVSMKQWFILLVGFWVLFDQIIASCIGKKRAEDNFWLQIALAGLYRHEMIVFNQRKLDSGSLRLVSSSITLATTAQFFLVDWRVSFVIRTNRMTSFLDSQKEVFEKLRVASER